MPPKVSLLSLLAGRLGVMMVMVMSHLAALNGSFFRNITAGFEIQLEGRVDPAAMRVVMVSL